MTPVDDSYRKDGWPLCPRCGEDELWSARMYWWNGSAPRPTLAECFAHDFGCYLCGWRGCVPPLIGVKGNHR